MHRCPKASMRPTDPKVRWQAVKSPVSARLSPALVCSSLRSNTVTPCPKRADPCGPRWSVRTNPKVHPPFPPTVRPVSPPESGPSRSYGCPVAGTPAPTRRPGLSPEGFRLPVLSASRPASNKMKSRARIRTRQAQVVVSFRDLKVDFATRAGEVFGLGIMAKSVLKAS